MVFGTADKWWCLKDRNFTRLFSLASLCLRLEVAPAKELGHESWGAAQQVVLSLVERWRKSLLPQELTHGLLLVISLGVRWVCESEPHPASIRVTVPILLRRKSRLCLTVAAQLFRTTAMRLPTPPRSSKNLPQHHLSSASSRLLVVTNGGIFHHFLGCVLHCSLPVAAPSVRGVVVHYQKPSTKPLSTQLLLSYGNSATAFSWRC